MNKFIEIASKFDLAGKAVSAKPCGSGLINDTYLITTEPDETPNYILQRINHSIFTDVDLLQENMVKITEHIRKRLQQAGAKDIDRRTLTVVPTKDGKLYYFDGESYWRVTIAIRDCVTHEQGTPEMAYRTGRAFGEFHAYFIGDDVPSLGETIPGFHNMSARLRQLDEAVKADKMGRLEKVRPIVDKVLDRAEEMTQAERLYAEGKLPKRISHCDTKVNNILFDKDDNVLCVIDLDTTMPGFVLSDFGDFMRTAGNTGAEDDPDLSRIGVNMEVFRAFTKGYIETAAPMLTDIERKMLPFGAKLLTYMTAVRFLTDYLKGDVYFKIQHPEHNLQRTLAQLQLLKSFDEHTAEMDAYIASL